MDINIKEQEIANLILQDLPDDCHEDIIKVWYYTGRDVRNEYEGYSVYFSYDTVADVIIPKSEVSWDYELAIKEVLIHKANHGEPYSDVLITLFTDGSYEFKYWYDEERIYKQEYESALRRSKDFPHAMAKALVFYHLAEVNFKKKYERIIMTFEIKEGEPFVDYYLVNEKGQHKPVYDSNKVAKYEETITRNTSNVKTWLKEHYERTNHGILKDIWKPWNKIVVSVPPSGYLNQLEDIHYYLDELELEKDFFLERY
ncbi:hypothetical protein [Flectobacillus sp. BAB-3569]|uniref:hypothetical protein n=1 Tax=Flectobacillus sp. BAB-3569 TaxID=1509483 RepID=UPI000BA39F8A|nr:hypothetical protein [Flectobacillus sp. BAB-3569]PAC31116.1 hypothetical protein BWI92_10365 [Flectobacillus sp. BAB-3569]